MRCGCIEIMFVSSCTIHKVMVQVYINGSRGDGNGVLNSVLKCIGEQPYSSEML